jgi:hypothetical protein
MPEYIDPSYFSELEQTGPSTLTEKTNCSYDAQGGNYRVHIWGRDYLIDPKRQTVECQDRGINVHEYFELFLIYYLLRVKKSAPSGEWISEKDISGGATFFRGPHQVPTEFITAVVNNDLEKFRRICADSGGKAMGMADLAFAFEISPEIPVAVLYWQGDDDFGAEARLLFDRSIEKLLPLDIIFALAYNVCHVLGEA